MLGLLVGEGDGNGERLVSMLCFERREMYAENPETAKKTTVPVCFTAGVCTDPAYRRRGFIRLLLSELERRMNAEGAAAVLLQPFDFGFYQKLGYLPFAKRSIVTAGENLLPVNADGYAVTEPTAELMSAAYEQAFAGKNGVLKRDRAHFEALANEFALPGAKAAAVKRGASFAYALWYGEEAPLAEEFAWTDDAARAALERVLAERTEGFRCPIPVGKDGGEYFNMIRILDEKFDYLLTLDPPPFDFTKY